jgi:hypothetical protein
MTDLILGNLEWVVMGGLAVLAAIFKLRGDKHKTRADQLAGYKDTRNDLDEADTFHGGDDARRFLHDRKKRCCALRRAESRCERPLGGSRCHA